MRIVCSWSYERRLGGLFRLRWCIIFVMLIKHHHNAHVRIRTSYLKHNINLINNSLFNTHRSETTTYLKFNWGNVASALVAYLILQLPKRLQIRGPRRLLRQLLPDPHLASLQLHDAVFENVSWRVRVTEIKVISVSARESSCLDVRRCALAYSSRSSKENLLPFH